MDSVSRRYYEQELGAGIGPSMSGTEHFGYTEPLRRFVQRESFEPQANEIPNTAPSWLPGDDYYTNFKVGDPFIKVDQGYARLPGAGYEGVPGALILPYTKTFTRPRHVKPVAEKLGIARTVDFRSFRTMHAGLMRRYGARLEVARDNMGHAGNTGSITLDVYSKTWWNERVEAVSRVVEAVFAEPVDDEQKIVSPALKLPASGGDKDWEPFWELQAILANPKSL